jgi:plasmid segregation protein ParM
MEETLNIGIDIGYSAVKAVSGERRVTLPSIVGTPDLARFGLSEGQEIVLETANGPVLVGQGAVEQSRFVNRREDRAWIESDEYYTLFLASLSELSSATSIDVTLVTGLPVAFYSDHDHLASILRGEHHVARSGAGRRAQLIRVLDCRVIPQPFGALLSAALDDRGRIVNDDLTGRVGVIDIGGKTTNILSVSRLRELARETASLSLGGWDVVRAVREALAVRCPGLDLRDHQLVAAVAARQVSYYGEPVDLGPVVEAILEPLAEQIIAQATQLWNGGAALDAILVAGGGALLLGERICRHPNFRHARLVDDPIFANAIGYWKLAMRIHRREESE